jgi:hypothetical protein
MRVKWREACSLHGKNEKPTQNLVRKPEGKRPFQRSGHRQEDNDKIFTKGICEGMDWIYFIQDRDQWLALVSTVTNLLIP